MKKREFLAEFAKTLELPEVHMQQVYRAIQESGLIVKGLHGRHAADITAETAASLLIAVMESEQPKRAVQAVKDYSPMTFSKMIVGEISGEDPRNGMFNHEVRFDEAVAAVLKLNGELFGGSRLDLSSVTLLPWSKTGFIEINGVVYEYHDSEVYNVAGLENWERDLKRWRLFVSVSSLRRTTRIPGVLLRHIGERLVSKGGEGDGDGK